VDGLRFERIFIGAATVFFLLFSTGICLAIFLPDAGNEVESGPSSVLSPEEARELFVVEEVDIGMPLSGPEEMMQAALAEASTWIADDLRISEYSVGADGQRFYMLSTAAGGNAGWIAIDVYGNLLSIRDFTFDPPYFTDVKLEREQAEAVALGLLERLGFEEDSLEIMNSELRSTGAADLPTWEYVIEFKPCLNGIFVDEGDYCDIRLSPTDGQVISIDTKRSPLRMRQAPAETAISEEEALDIALQKASEGEEGLEFSVSKDGIAVDGGGIRLRYMLPGQFYGKDPMLSWRISIDFHYTEVPFSSGGQYEVIVNALTGEAFIVSKAYYG
jgi:hypothetical protein